MLFVSNKFNGLKFKPLWRTVVDFLKIGKDTKRPILMLQKCPLILFLVFLSINLYIGAHNDTALHTVDYTKRFTATIVSQCILFVKNIIFITTTFRPLSLNLNFLHS